MSARAHAIARVCASFLKGTSDATAAAILCVCVRPSVRACVRACACVRVRAGVCCVARAREYGVRACVCVRRARARSRACTCSRACICVYMRACCVHACVCACESLRHVRACTHARVGWWWCQLRGGGGRGGSPSQQVVGEGDGGEVALSDHVQPRPATPSHGLSRPLYTQPRPAASPFTTSALPAVGSPLHPGVPTPPRSPASRRAPGVCVCVCV